MPSQLGCARRSEAPARVCAAGCHARVRTAVHRFVSVLQPHGLTRNHSLSHSLTLSLSLSLSLSLPPSPPSLRPSLPLAAALSLVEQNRALRTAVFICACIRPCGDGEYRCYLPHRRTPTARDFDWRAAESAGRNTQHLRGRRGAAPNPHVRLDINFGILQTVKVAYATFL